MSECVVRMEMPEGCWCCPFGHYDWIWGDDGREKMVCFCRLDLESEEDGHYLLETELKRPSWCPILCQLPEGHGRLIDWDAFERAGFKLCRKTSECRAELGTPTNESYVVPAERSET